MFDTEKLIVEVEKRPALYNQTLKEYANRDSKTNLWDEIGNEMYPTWKDMSREERNKLAKELQTKWKSIRDHFKKEVALERKTKSGQEAKLKKKYIYYEQLLFLKTYITNKSTSSNLDDLQRNETVEAENAPESTDANTNSLDSTNPEPRRKATKRKLTNDNTEIREITNILAESVALQREEKEKDDMGNKAFMMSFVPLMNNMPTSQLIACRSKIMEVFQMFNTQSAYNSIPTYTNPYSHNQYSNFHLQSPNYLPHNSHEFIYNGQASKSFVPTSLQSSVCASVCNVSLGASSQVSEDGNGEMTYLTDNLTTL